jgi:hypothetical protein
MERGGVPQDTGEEFIRAQRGDRPADYFIHRPRGDYVLVSFTVPWLILTAGRPRIILTMPISLPQLGQTGREPVGIPETPR